MAFRERAPKKKRKKAVVRASLIGGLLLLLAFLFRNCLGLGVGTHDSNPGLDAMPVTARGGDARGGPAAQDANADRGVCKIRLDSKGLWVDGKAAEIADAVRICQRAGRVSLHATGGARTGTYHELVRALEQAGVEGVPRLEEH